ncbi:MAG: PAS domain-containing sensor histidine kinase, partial [Rhodospirillales bacterium]|nr:PAS domain-containing sensor histidine kinase [Rhodospirillales bacterium]
MLASALLSALVLGLADGPALLSALAASAAVAMLALGLLARRMSRLRAAGARARHLEAVLDAEPQARLVIAAGGAELHRNPAARLFGPAADPLAPFEARAVGDERLLEELARLKTAAQHGVPHHAELALGSAEGGREWLAVSVRPVSFPAGAVLWSAADVSARRAIEETLRREQELLTDFLDFV